MEYQLGFPATSISGVDLVLYDEIQSENGSQDERGGDGGVPNTFPMPRNMVGRFLAHHFPLLIIL